jgi:hypothetical protein
MLEEKHPMAKTDRSGRFLELLLHEVAEARDDDRYMFAQYAVIVGSAVVVIGAMATVLYQTCPAGYAHCPPDGKSETPISIWIYVGAPILPIALIAYAIFISAINVLRSYYLRVLERMIHETTGQSSDPLPIPSWAHVQLEVTGQSHSGRSGRLDFILIYVTISAMVLACLCLAFLKIPIVRYRIFALAVDGTFLAILIEATLSNVVQGSLLWDAARKGLRARLIRTDIDFPIKRPPPGERSLNSFLLLPRNQEELLKALFIPVCFGLGSWLSPGALPWNTQRFWEVAGAGFGFFLVFEFLVYQARYLLNDIKDRYIDCKKLSKPRFPCSLLDNGPKEERALRRCFASFVARLLIAGLLVICILPVEHWRGYTLSLFSIFAIAAPYEFLRNRCNGGSGEKSWRSIWTVALLGNVGLGYALRSVVGLWLAGVDDKGDLLRLSVGGWLLGVTFVGLTWALESTRDSPEVLASGKGHLLWFRGFVTRAADRAMVAVTPEERVLQGWQSLWAPWSVSTVAATATLATFALYLVRGCPDPLVIPLIIHKVGISESALLFAGTATLISLFAVMVPLWASFISTAGGLVWGSVALHHRWLPIGPSVAVMVISGLPLILSCAFRGSAFKDLPGFTDKIIKIGAGGAHLLYERFKQPRSEASRRVPLVLLDAPEGVFTLQPRRAAILVDIEGTLTDFSPSGSSVIEAIKHFDEIAKQNGFETSVLHYVTNAELKELEPPPGLEGRIHRSACKPFFTPPQEFLLRANETTIVGDQYLTDGLLGRVWPRLQLFLGKAVARLFFRLASG